MGDIDVLRIQLIEISHIPCGVFTFADNRVVAITVSQGFCDLYECTREYALDILNNHIYDNVHPDDVARLGDAALKFTSGSGDYNVIFRVDVNGKYKIIHARGKHIYNSKKERQSIIWYSDEGLYQDDTRELYDQAFSYMLQDSRDNFVGGYDPLTGLPNMNYFFKLAETARDQLIEEGKSSALLYFDFNGMKNYNLKYGFIEGDKLIIEMARVLATHYSNINCCRFGGDRFAVVTTEERLEEELLEVLDEVKDLNEGKSIPVRVGVYKNSMGYVSVGTACDRAKMACDTKREEVHSSFIYFDENMLNESEIRHYILENIDRAIDNKWLEVYYQPLVRAINGGVSDEEALIRWIDPVYGFMVPDSFIPVLEEAKLLHRLDLYVLDSVLERMNILRENNLYVVPCSINISRYDFETCDMVEEIRRRVDDAGVSRDMITIEITEGAVGANVDYIRKQVEVLNELGFKVWMDDYGSGYSSPTILQTISFDTIKLDMMFMRQFDKSEKSKLIVWEIINLALSLGLETVVEGVETKEQVEFLKNAGATKLQGYYFTKPLPTRDILRRYEMGEQIGFENPAESEYYAAIGKVKLYDVSFSSYEEDAKGNYLNTAPASVYEVNGDHFSIVRCNSSYRRFLVDIFGVYDPYLDMTFSKYLGLNDDDFAADIYRCAMEGGKLFEDRIIGGKLKVHMLIRRVAVNPVTNARAVAVVLFDVREISDSAAKISFASVAKAMSSDYLSLYHVDLSDNSYVRYSHSADSDELNIGYEGKDFFEDCKKEALRFVCEEDRDVFIEQFTREKILDSIAKTGKYTTTCRLLMYGVPTYVNLKATPMDEDARHLILAVYNVDFQMRERERAERMKEEVLAYTRLSALAGNFIVFYTVDVESESFTEFKATSDYESLNVSKSGQDFFAKAKAQAEEVIHPEDIGVFKNSMNKENVMHSIERKGYFSIKYRLLIGNVPRYVLLKATLLKEDGVDKLIFGIMDIDDETKREQEYAINLAVARNKVNLDSLTGVKNKYAYSEIENGINNAIRDHTCAPFAIGVFDINNLKETNDLKGHSAGDELIKKACSIICKIFRHSPVFRVGGDEFAIIAKEEDYDKIDELMSKFLDINLKSQEEGGVVIAGGLSRFDGDECVNDVFKRADELMYENKKKLKEG